MITDRDAFLLDQSTLSSVSLAAVVGCRSTLNSTVSAADPCVAAVQSPDVRSWVGDVVAVLIAVLLSAVIIGTLLGNASVILAVSVYEKMRTLSNVLIASLGSADLLVAIVVMPISLQVR